VPFVCQTSIEVRFGTDGQQSVLPAEGFQGAA
jgi:hypothetical protein